VAVFPPMWPAISDAICPIVRARMRLVGGKATPMVASREFSISDAHQRIQSEVSQRLIVAQTVWLDA
jgi:hypothetical protein